MSGAKVVEVKIKHAFGRKIIEPINDWAIFFTEFLKQETLTEDNISGIKKLGFNIKVQAEEL